MMKETNIQSQVTSTIAGDDGEAVANSEETAKKLTLQMGSPVKVCGLGIDLH